MGKFVSLNVSIVEDQALVGEADLHIHEIQVSVVARKDGTDADAAGYHLKIVWEWKPVQSGISSVVRHISSFRVHYAAGKGFPIRISGATDGTLVI